MPPTKGNRSTFSTGRPRSNDDTLSSRGWRRRLMEGLASWNVDAGGGDVSSRDDSNGPTEIVAVENVSQVNSEEEEWFEPVDCATFVEVPRNPSVESVSCVSNEEVPRNPSVENVSCVSNEDDKWFEPLECGTLFYDCEICIDCKCVSCDECCHKEFPEACSHCENCLCDTMSVSSENSSDHFCDLIGEDDGDNSGTEVIESSEEKHNRAVREDLIDLAIAHNMKQDLLDDVLSLLRKYNVAQLPKCARTLLKTPLTVSTRPVPPGEYWHNGLEKHVKIFLDKNETNVVNITFNVDGIPIAKSSGAEFWPILCSMNDHPDVYLIGAWYGNSKPNDSNEFLKDFVEEMEMLATHGIEHKGHVVPVNLTCAACDAPAKSLIMKTKGHTGYFSCSKCATEGDYLDHRMSFPELDARLRTDESFIQQEQKEHHTGSTKLLSVPRFCPVSFLPLDYLHLLLLGVMRKIMYMWLAGPLSVRQRAAVATKISQALVQLTLWVPREFARRPRSLDFIKRFKATEFRQILLYTGPVIFYKALPRKLYEHFLVFHVATTILVDPKYCIEFLDYAHQLMVYFVETFKKLYGIQYVSHNVHNMIHLASCVAKFGPLDKFSCFKFENYLQKIKKWMRKGEKPLQQLARRYAEAEQVETRKSKRSEEQRSQQAYPMYSGHHTNGPLLEGCINPQFTNCRLRSGITIDLSEANNCCILQSGSVVLVKNFCKSTSDGEVQVIGREFKTLQDVYTVPCNSSTLGIYHVSFLSQLKSWPVSLISNKCYRMPWKDGFAVFPLRHGADM